MLTYSHHNLKIQLQKQQQQQQQQQQQHHLIQQRQTYHKRNLNFKLTRGLNLRKYHLALETLLAVTSIKVDMSEIQMEPRQLLLDHNRDVPQPSLKKDSQ